jgi:aspartyl-tRNA(Asn)/glutamyl-tRNA(Gln) amidotransferase subunit C
MAKMTREEVLKLAKLSKLALTDEEIENFSIELEEILGYVEQLKAVDTTGLRPTTQGSPNQNVTREDVVQDYGYEPADLLKQVPAVENNQIKVKRMIG